MAPKRIFPIFCLMFALPAAAQLNLAPCQDDIAKSCSPAVTGAKDLLLCLGEQVGLQPACQEHLQALKTVLDKVETQCGSDITQFCSTVPPGRGLLLNCLNGKRDALSFPCKTAVEKANQFGRKPRPRGS